LFLFHLCHFGLGKQTLLKSMQEIFASIHCPNTQRAAEASASPSASASGSGSSFWTCQPHPASSLPAGSLFPLQIDTNWRNEIAISCDKFQ